MKHIELQCGTELRHDEACERYYCICIHAVSNGYCTHYINSVIYATHCYAAPDVHDFLSVHIFAM